MSTAELDPLFFKGLRLLHSKSKDSADQLKQLLDDVISQSRHSTYKDRAFTSGKLDIDSKLHLKKSSARDVSEITTVNLKQNIEEKERKLEKRQFEKVKQDFSDNFHDAKIPKLETPQVFSSVHFSNLLQYPPSPDIPQLDQYMPRKDEESDSSEENGDADDFAMEMGLACVICKQIDVSHGNQLIECQECHSLYHQECHRPPATDYDVNDPRKVWYCAKCMKNMKKMATKTQKTSKPGVTTVAKEPISQAKFSKTENSPPALILPFKRSELKAPVSQSNVQASANKPIGLAGLAANFSGRVTAATSSTAAQPSRVVNSKTSVSLNLKTFSSFASISSSTKSSNPAGTSTSASKTMTSSVNFPALSSISSVSSPTLSTTTSIPILIPKTSSSSASTKSASTHLSTLAAPVAAVARGATGSNNGNSGGHISKTASCSPLMSADKRVQIMKKKAAKLQEKRRLSTK